MSDEVMYDSKEDCYMVPEELFEEMEKAVAELSSLKSRLPVNADGDVVLWGDTVYYSVNDEIKTLVAKVITPNTEGTSWIISNGEEFLYITDCHSTAESCRAANTQAD